MLPYLFVVSFAPGGNETSAQHLNGSAAAESIESERGWKTILVYSQVVSSEKRKGQSVDMPENV